MPAASTVKPIVSGEDYASVNAATDWNEGTVAATAPPNWAEDGTAVPLAAAPATPAANLDWAVCSYINIFIQQCCNIIYFYF